MCGYFALSLMVGVHVCISPRIDKESGKGGALNVSSDVLPRSIAVALRAELLLIADIEEYWMLREIWSGLQHRGHRGT